MDNLPKGPDDQQGHIRISSKEKRHYHIHRRFLYIILGVVFLILSAFVMMLVMRDYTDRKISETNTLLAKESSQYNELEKRIYDRENFRVTYDIYSNYVVGVAGSRDGFLKNVPAGMASGLIFDNSGNILVPARMVRGRTSAFVRMVAGAADHILEGQVVGIDEPTGIAMLNVPALSRDAVPKYEEIPLIHLQTVFLMGIPSGNPDHGNLTIGGIHSPEDSYAVDTGNNQTDVSMFTISPAVYEGNDGGAVVTLDGRLAGMASLELTRTLGLAPYTAVFSANELKIIGERILKHESVESLSLGVTGEIIDYAPLARTGYYVLEVLARSTADRGGVRPTDIILSVDGQPMIRNRLIDSYMKGKKVGDDLRVELLRAQEIIVLNMKVY